MKFGEKSKISLVTFGSEKQHLNKENVTLVSESESKLEKSRVMYDAKLVAADGSSRENGEKNMLQTPCGINISRFSSFTDLLRVTALVLRFIAKLKKVKNVNGPLEAQIFLSLNKNG